MAKENPKATKTTGDFLEGETSSWVGCQKVRTQRPKDRTLKYRMIEVLGVF